ncbi:MAG: exonuclease domain-containing protein [Oscillospiraceae bacterium]|nr:exonuclease domain-containing protein [Oscillospiraceae bacterium]
MQHVFLDFEMNPIPRDNQEARAIALSEIIQIGAVKLNDDYQLVDRFSLNVRPVLNQIQPNITALTGIHQSDVDGAPLLVDALAQFAAWIGDEKTRVYSWSDTDRRQLEKECRLKNLTIPSQFRRWMDFQRVYTRLMGLSRRSPLSLKNALGASETDFEGSQHSAVADAENSASLLQLVKDKEAFRERTKIVMQVMGKAEEPAGTTLGDLFDFGKIRERKPSPKKNGKKKKR